MKSTVEDIYEKLVNVDKILTLKGKITFQLGEIGITIRKRDVVGNVMQEWVEAWLKHNQIEYALDDNTQMPPDFYLDPDDRTKNLMELKTFNIEGAPGFDIADFHMYEQEIAQKPWMLDVTYLIFGYKMSEDGVVTIEKVWKKKVWEMSRPMRTGSSKVFYAINLQIKKGTVHKIRPAKWYAESSKFKIFENKEDFLSAMEDAIYQNPDTRPEYYTWRGEVSQNYKKHYGEELSFPKWDEIKNKYAPDAE